MMSMPRIGGIATLFCDFNSFTNGADAPNRFAAEQNRFGGEQG